jgi:hypothetical protein
MATLHPTREGLRRWPHTSGYHPDISTEHTRPDPELPCTCAAGCAARCGGECGCKACGFAFAQFCDEAGFGSGRGIEVSEDEALAHYRRS